MEINDIEEQLKNEENTKLNYITPAIQKKWNNEGDRICMEYNKNTNENAYYFTDGRIIVNEDNTVTRGKQKKVDYLLLFKNNIPLAIVEAKGYDHDLSEGIQQAIDYAKLLDVPYAYSSNGRAFHEEDLLEGVNREFDMDSFPTSDELWERYKKSKNIENNQERVIVSPYYTSFDERKPRYYQRIAINRAIQAIAQDEKRLLLVMATGTGKTYTAMQIIYKLWATGSKKKILFLVDRNPLADQTYDDFTPFKKVMVKLGSVINGMPLDAHTKEGVKNLAAYQVFISLYHQLKNGNNNYYENLPKDFFDLIVVDECHRGSVAEKNPRDKDDEDVGNWHDILEYFSSATQIGLTATPKETNDVSNISYFGEPIYTYSLKQGIEDGFLAPYKVVYVELDIDRDGYMPEVGTIDLNGNEVEQRRYEQKEFDRNIIVQERREIVAKRITDYLKATDRFQKTIIFCETEEHAGAMMNLLKNLNSDLVKEDSRYIMRITSSDEIGKNQIKNFSSTSQKYPTIAVTSKLLSTGVDTKTTELIVLDKTIGSMTEFKQTIGRGTRIKEKYKVENEEKSKTHFTILDFRKNYLKFQDPEFDGEPIEVIDGNKQVPKRENYKPKEKVKEIIKVKGVEVGIVGEEVRYLDEEGKLIKTNLKSCIRNNILSNFDSYDKFLKAWFIAEDKNQLANELLISDEIIREMKEKYGKIDRFDIISVLAYDREIISKEERIKRKDVQEFLNSLKLYEKDLINLLLECYKNSDFNDLRNLQIFDLPLFVNKGINRKIAINTFGSVGEYLNKINVLEQLLYKEEK